VIRTLLVANRGEIARRILRTCRAMGIRTAAVFSPADRDEPFVAEADVAVPLGGGIPAASYLDAGAIIAAAGTVDADAIHPGYGFLAEDPAFARKVLDAGLVWVGPPPEVMATMSSKLDARAAAESALVPVVPGAEIGADPHAAAAVVGYPLLVKAAAGGGGRGMRLVGGPEELDAALTGAAREAEAAFGDGTVYLERLLPHARHVEVQILGDRHGGGVDLGARDCSIQRRHQKLVEESPPPDLPGDIEDALRRAAVDLGVAVGYVGAGTVEFLVAGDEYFFLEMNTRLQVEHPVTEMVTGLDLVRLQIEIAAGGAVPDPATIRIAGHAVEARLYAEDPLDGYLPTHGRVECFAAPDLPGIRVDAGAAGGSMISPHYDTLLAKVVARGDTRAEALRKLERALRLLRLHGPVTNRDLLVGIVEHPEVVAGAVDTGFLDRHDPARLAETSPEVTRRRLAAVALADMAHARATAPVLGSIRSGFRNLPAGSRRRVYRHRDTVHTVDYAPGRRGVAAMTVDGDELDIVVYALTGDRVDAAVGGVRRVVDVHRAGDRRFVDDAEGGTSFSAVSRIPEPETEPAAPGALTAPLPGIVRQVHVVEGATVDEHAPLVTLEAMKMEHVVVAPARGVVAGLAVRPGDRVDAGAVLVVVEPAGGDEPSEGELVRR